MFLRALEFVNKLINENDCKLKVISIKTRMNLTLFFIFLFFCFDNCYLNDYDSQWKAGDVIRRLCNEGSNQIRYRSDSDLCTTDICVLRHLSVSCTSRSGLLFTFFSQPLA